MYINKKKIEACKAWNFRSSIEAIIRLHCVIKRSTTLRMRQNSYINKQQFLVRFPCAAYHGQPQAVNTLTSSSTGAFLPYLRILHNAYMTKDESNTKDGSNKRCNIT